MKTEKEKEEEKLLKYVKSIKYEKLSFCRKVIFLAGKLEGIKQLGEEIAHQRKSV